MKPCLLYVGTEEGVFVFRWRGTDVAQLGRGLQGNAVRGIAVHPEDARSVYIACGLRGWGLHRSQDAGQSFESLGFMEQWVWDVVFHPNDHQTLYIGTEPPMLYVSHDSGRTFDALQGIDALPSRSHWHFFHPPFRDQPMKAGHVHGIALHPKRPERIFAGVEQGAVIFSEDGGQTWKEALVGHDVHRMAVDPADPDRIFAGTGAGLFVSEDGGKTWDPQPVLYGYVHAIRFDPRRPETVYAYTDGSHPLSKSTDAGRTWQTVGTELPPAGPADSLDLHPVDPAIVFYGGDTGPGQSRLFVSPDEGGTWRMLEAELPKVWRLRTGRLSDSDQGPPGSKIAHEGPTNLDVPPLQQ